MRLKKLKKTKKDLVIEEIKLEQVIDQKGLEHIIFLKAG